MITPPAQPLLAGTVGADETLARAGRARCPAGTTQTPVHVRLELTPSPSIAGHDLDDYDFGLQAPDRSLVPGTPTAVDSVNWTCLVVLVHGADDPPRWIGHYVHGPKRDEFLYLAWQHPDRPEWGMRIKAQFRPAEAWVKEIDAAQRPLLSADLTGRVPHDRNPVPWHLSDLTSAQDPR